MPGRAPLSIDELAATTGVSVRTIRYYQSEGLLPAPARHGREARYGDDHVDRLQLIAALQERGLRLNAIADLLARSPRGSAAEWLGLGETLEQPWTDDAPLLLSEADLAERVDGLDGAVDALTRSGIVERRADTVPVVYLVPSPALLDVALTWMRTGLDPEAGARMQAIMREHLRALADELVERFTEDVSIEQLTSAGPGGLARVLAQVRPLTRRALEIVFAHEMERATRAVTSPDHASEHEPPSDGRRSA